MNHYILDSCALMAFLLGEPEQVKVEHMLRQAEHQQINLSMPYTQYGEILYLTLKRQLQPVEFMRTHLLQLPITYTEITQALAEKAALFKAKGGISYSDCFVIAAAITQNGTILTKDTEFRKFENDVAIAWL